MPVMAYPAEPPVTSANRSSSAESTDDARATTLPESEYTAIEASLTARRRPRVNNTFSFANRIFKRARARSDQGAPDGEGPRGAVVQRDRIASEALSRSTTDSVPAPGSYPTESSNELYDREQVERMAREEIDRMGGEIGLFVVRDRGERVRVDDDDDDDDDEEVVEDRERREDRKDPNGLTRTRDELHNTSSNPTSSSPAPNPAARDAAQPLPATAVNLYAPSLTERNVAIEEVIRQREQVLKERQGEVVLDVLWENQRGILLFGLAFFSSNTLFPFDPPGWTIPAHVPSSFKDKDGQSHSKRSALSTSFTSAPQSRGGPSQDPRPSHQHGYTHDRKPLHKRDRRRRIRPSILTPYTIHTYQPPSDEWRWLTPWMIHMRSDGETDERGWEYNAWFRSGGWNCEVGRIGWARWVRRRKWVRYRTLDSDLHRGGPGKAVSASEGQLRRDILQAGREHERPVEEKDDDGSGDGGTTPTTRTEEKLPSRASYKPLALLGLIGAPGRNNHNGRALLSALAQLPTDRERLQQWQYWLGESWGKSAGELIEDLLDDSEMTNQFLQSMTFATSRQDLQALWSDHGLVPKSK